MRLLSGSWPISFATIVTAKVVPILPDGVKNYALRVGFGFMGLGRWVL
jgi:hypothetical protein